MSRCGVATLKTVGAHLVYIAAEPVSSDSNDRLRTNCVGIAWQREFGSQGSAPELHSIKLGLNASRQFAVNHLHWP
jgi:hypothetical protein